LRKNPENSIIIFKTDEGELIESATIANFATTAMGHELWQNLTYKNYLLVQFEDKKQFKVSKEYNHEYART
jgi:hypothetical protein